MECRNSLGKPGLVVPVCNIHLGHLGVRGRTVKSKTSLRYLVGKKKK